MDQNISTLLLSVSLLCTSFGLFKQVNRLKREVKRQKDRAEKYKAIVKKEGIYVVEDDFESEIMEEVSANRYGRNAIIASLVMLVFFIFSALVIFKELNAMIIFLIYWVIIVIIFAIVYFVMKSKEK